MYKRANSYNAADFLNRFLYLLKGKIENVQTDNGSEFEKFFAQACAKMNLERYYNWPRTPKDNRLMNGLIKHFKMSLLAWVISIQSLTFLIEI